MTTVVYDPEVTIALPQLTHSDPEVRRIALIGIADYADEYPELFVASSRDTDAGVRLEAARALEGSADAAAVNALVDLLSDPDAAVRQAAAISLSEIQEASAGPVLLQCLDDASSSARAAILAGLRKLRLPQALAPALASLDDARPEVRREAVGVLGYLKDAQALPRPGPLVAGDTDEGVRLAAVGALAFATDDTVLPPLLAGLSDVDWQVQSEERV